MVFASVIFLLFFLPLVVAIYYLVPYSVRNYWLILSSVVFYFWGSGLQDTGLLLLIAIVDYYFAKKIVASRQPKTWLITSIVWNLGLLCYFKYAHFFFGSLYLKLTGQTLLPHALPLGISFFIFETIAYVSDVYLGRQKPAKKLTDYAMYLTFFPHLVAGPIYRFGDISNDLNPKERSLKTSSETIFQGFCLFSFGLAKKCLIANPMAAVADFVYNQPTHTFIEAWVGSLAYTFQIYFDFSGYSTIAVGLGMIFGFLLPQNFNQPYCATSMTDFWKRWHMSLSHWFRDYLYIPLGGNRKGPWITYRNLFLVFFLCGLWHGASWCFIFWGIYHGLWLVAERAGLSPLRFLPGQWVPRLATFLLAVLGWVLFRSETLGQAQDFYSTMLTSKPNLSASRDFWILLTEDYYTVVVFTLAAFSIFPFERCQELVQRWSKHYWLKGMIALALLVISIAELATNTFNPFIYFRF